MADSDYLEEKAFNKRGESVENVVVVHLKPLFSFWRTSDESVAFAVFSEHDWTRCDEKIVSDQKNFNGPEAKLVCLGVAQGCGLESKLNRV